MAPSRSFADAIAFLASEDAAYVNGVVLPVDGGGLTATSTRTIIVSSPSETASATTWRNHIERCTSSRQTPRMPPAPPCATCTAFSPASAGLSFVEPTEPIPLNHRHLPYPRPANPTPRVGPQRLQIQPYAGLTATSTITVIISSPAQSDTASTTTAATTSTQ